MHLRGETFTRTRAHWAARVATNTSVETLKQYVVFIQDFNSSVCKTNQKPLQADTVTCVVVLLIKSVKYLSLQPKWAQASRTVVRGECVALRSWLPRPYPALMRDGLPGRAVPAGRASPWQLKCMGE